MTGSGMNPWRALPVHVGVRMFSVVVRQRILLALLVGLAGLIGLGLPALAQDEGEDEGGETPSCIDYEGHARYRAYGYDHLVRVTNGCDKPAVCQVWTDVTPEKHRISLRPDETEEVLTRTGSPAREFTPRVSCQLRE